MNNRITELRATHGMTQEELAQRANTTRQTIISIEKGRYDPGIKVAMRIARAFELRVDDVFMLD